MVKNEMSRSAACIVSVLPGPMTPWNGANWNRYFLRHHLWYVRGGTLLAPQKLFRRLLWVTVLSQSITGSSPFRASSLSTTLLVYTHHTDDRMRFCFFLFLSFFLFDDCQSLLAKHKNSLNELVLHLIPTDRHLHGLDLTWPRKAKSLNRTEPPYL